MQTDQNPPVPPAWVRWFVNDASKGIIDRDSIAPVGCHYFYDSSLDTWEVSLFVSRTEMVGGPSDGCAIPTGLQVDINVVRSAFDAEPQIHWQAEPIAPDDELGNHISFEGIARTHRVWLRILDSAPTWASPGRVMHAQQGIFEDLW